MQTIYAAGENAAAGHVISGTNVEDPSGAVFLRAAAGGRAGVGVRRSPERWQGVRQADTLPPPAGRI